MCQFEELFDAAKLGDREAFDQLFSHYRESVGRFIEMRLGERLRRRVEPHDILQEAALRALRSIDQIEWRGIDPFRNWLFGIVIHIIQEHARRFINIVDPGNERAIEDSGTSASRHVLRHERFERLEKSLSRLSEEHQQVIRMTRIEGIPVREVARRMERSEKATYQLLWRATKKLKEFFGDTASLRLPDRRLLDLPNHAEQPTPNGK